ncbi:MAG: hypothetical protein HUU02_00575 [Bacteroidetes bacterium]|nr:hypothetical protein [Bacteroidota bacterium]
MKRSLLPILAAAAWIGISEFVRNQFLLRSYWTDHYSRMGLTFPADPVNGAVWGIWSLLFAGVIFVLRSRFDLRETFVLSWFIGFVMMWVVIGNLGVLPFGILPYALPLSMVEAFGAVWIVGKLKE